MADEAAVHDQLRARDERRALRHQEPDRLGDLARLTEPAERRALLEEFDRWLGLDLLTAEVSREAQESDPRIDALVAERQAARGRRDFAEADRLRDALAAEGIVVDDTPEGPKWRRK